MNFEKKCWLLFNCILLISLISCTQKSSLSEEAMEIIKTYSNSKVEGIFIIPYFGCSPCNEKAEEFLIDNSNINYYFVLTGFESSKQLNIKIGKHLDKKQVILDDDFNLYKYKLELNYPVFFKVDNGEIVEKYIMNPENYWLYESQL